MSSTASSRETKAIKPLPTEVIAKPQFDSSKYYEEETKFCREFTANTRVTADDQKRTDPSFNRFIAVSKRKGEYPYIIPEFSPMKSKEDKAELNPALVQWIEKINSGAPYHTFIERLGITGPILTRLYLGSSDGRFKKLETEQFLTLLNTCYWQDYARQMNLKIRNVPLMQDEKIITPEANHLMSAIFKDEQDSEALAKKFIEAMSSPGISRGEKDILRIELDVHFYRFIREAIKNREHCDVLPPEAEKLFPEEQALLYSTSEFKELTKSGMLYELMKYNMGCFQIAIDEKTSKPYLVLPSITMLREYANIYTPGRNLKIQALLGIWDLDALEHYNNRNTRPVSVYLCGVTNPLMSHGIHNPPGHGMLHDIFYHYFIESTLEIAIPHQMARAAHNLRQICNDRWTNETSRLFDRVHRTEVPQFSRFYYLLENTFGLYKKQDSYASIIQVIDMILAPEHWPFYAKASNPLKRRLMDLLLPHREAATTPDEVVIDKISLAVNQYWAKTERNPGLTAILLFIHFQRNGQGFCEKILALKKKYPAEIFHKWDKGKNKFIVPYLVILGQAIELEAVFLNDNHQKQVEGLLNPDRYRPVPLVPPSTKAPVERKTSSAMIIHRVEPRERKVQIQISSWSAIKRKAVLQQGGGIIDQSDEEALIEISPRALTKEVCVKLELIQMPMNFTPKTSTEKRAYLASKGIVAECTKEFHKFMLIFSTNKKSIISDLMKEKESADEDNKLDIDCGSKAFANSIR